MENLFKSILNEQLSSVTFVQDYLQLSFDGKTLTCYSWPIIKTLSDNYDHQKQGYKDALCEIITYKVKNVLFIENEILEIAFYNEHSISLTLSRNESNIDLSESAYFKNEDQWFVLD
ncbi:MAG: hypothetical protein ABIN95_03355 [Mucilaginibacter sp.]